MQDSRRQLLNTLVAAACAAIAAPFSGYSSTITVGEFDVDISAITVAGGRPTGGTFTVTWTTNTIEFRGATTSEQIPWYATPEQIEAAINKFHNG